MNGRVFQTVAAIALAVGSAGGLTALAAGPAAAAGLHAQAGRGGAGSRYVGPWEELINQAHGLCLDAASSHDGSNGDTVQLWSCSGAVNQMWRQNGGEWQNEAHSLCLDADSSGDHSDGDKIQLWSCSGGINQQWSYSDLVFTNQAAGLVLDAASSHDGSNGDTVQLWSYSGGENQQWYP